MDSGRFSGRRWIERGIYQQPNGKYMVCVIPFGLLFAVQATASNRRLHRHATL